MIARPLPRPGPIPFANAALANAMSNNTRNVATGQAFLGKALSTQWHPQRAVSMSMSAGGTDKPGHPGHMGRTNSHNSAHSSTGQENTDGPRSREMRATFHGHGVLSVRSSVTGKLYRFQGHADTLVIDPRDALLLGRLTDLQVR